MATWISTDIRRNWGPTVDFFLIADSEPENLGGSLTGVRCGIHILCNQFFGLGRRGNQFQDGTVVRVHICSFSGHPRNLGSGYKYPFYLRSC